MLQGTKAGRKSEETLAFVFLANHRFLPSAHSSFTLVDFPLLSFSIGMFVVKCALYTLDTHGSTNNVYSTQYTP